MEIMRLNNNKLKVTDTKEYEMTEDQAKKKVIELKHRIFLLTNEVEQMQIQLNKLLEYVPDVDITFAKKVMSAPRT